MRFHAKSKGMLIAIAIGLCAIGSDLMANETNRETFRLGTEGIERVRFSVSSGNSLLSLSFVSVEAEVVGTDGAEFRFECEGIPSGIGMPKSALTCRRDGDAITANLNLGDSRLVRIGVGTARLRIEIPRGFHGDLEISIREGSLAVRDLDLGTLKAAVNLGKLTLERITAKSLETRTKEASSTLTDCRAANGRIKTGLGSVRAESLAGSWSIEGQESSVTLSMAPDFGPLEIETGIGRVSVILPESAPYTLDASGGFRAPNADIALTKTDRVERGGRRVYVGSTEASGPLIRIRTNEGGISVTGRRD